MQRPAGSRSTRLYIPPFTVLLALNPSHLILCVRVLPVRSVRGVGNRYTHCSMATTTEERNAGFSAPVSGGVVVIRDAAAVDIVAAVTAAAAIFRRCVCTTAISIDFVG